MLTCTEEIFRENFGFRIFGKEDLRTQVYKFFDNEFGDAKIRRKLVSVLNAINSNPKMFSHAEKFKHLEDNVWEIKINQYRIACIWDAKPYNLIAIYAFKKNEVKWPKRHLDNMRKQKALYRDMRLKRIEGDYYGRNKLIEE